MSRIITSSVSSSLYSNTCCSFSRGYLKVVRNRELWPFFTTLVVPSSFAGFHRGVLRFWLVRRRILLRLWQQLNCWSKLCWQSGNSGKLRRLNLFQNSHILK